MATKNLVPRADLEGQLGIVSPVLRRWKQINAGTGQFDLLKTDQLQNTTGQPLLVAGDTSVSIVREETANGWQYKFTSQGGSGSAVSNKIFQGTGTDEVSVEAISDASNKEIKFSISSSLGWRIDENGHMLPYANNTNNIGSATERVKEVFLMPDALTFANGKINVSSSKRLQFGIPSGSSHVYDDISLTKSSVKVATTSSNEFAGFSYDNGSSTLTATSAGIISSVDTKSLSVNDRILVKSRTNKEENGIYVVTNAGSTTDSAVLTRATDLNKDENFIGTSVSVLEGTNNGQKLFFVTPSAAGGSTVGTHDQNWTTFGDSLDIAGVQTTVGSMFNSGGGISFTFDVSTGKLTPALSLALNDLSDVNVGTPGANEDNKVLQWNNTNSKFELDTVTSGGTPRTNEEIQDVVSNLISAGSHTGITFTYDDDNNKLSASVTDSDNFVKKNETTTFGSDSTTPTYDFHAKSVTVKVPTPTANEHAVNKQYVDTAMQGIDEVLTPVKAASTGNVILADLINGYSSIDGNSTALNTGDRVLLKDQTTASENGVYVVGTTGVGGGNNPTVRATDLAAGAQANAVFIFVEEGTQNANSGFICTSPTTSDTVDTHDLTFVKFSSAGQINARNALTLTGQDLDVNVDGTTIQIASDQLQVGTIGFGNISGSLPADKLPNTVLTIGSTITANSITAEGITGIDSISETITDLADMDFFIVHDNDETNASKKVKKGAAGRIIEYVGGRFTGDVVVTPYNEDTTDLEKLRTELSKTAFTLKPELSKTDTNTPASTASEAVKLAFKNKNTLQPDDLFLIADNSEQNTIKQVKFSDITSSALDIDGLSLTNNNDAPLSNDDKLAIYEESSTSNRKITINQLKSTLTGVKSLVFEDITTNDVTKVIQPQYHYNLREFETGSSTHTFIFYDNDTNSSRYKKPIEALPGEIVKISLTVNNDAHFYDSPLDPDTSTTAADAFDRRKISMTTNVFVELEFGNTIKYSQLDLTKPLEFIYTVNYNAAGDEIADSGKWRPYVGSSVHTPHMTHIMSGTTAGYAFNADSWARYKDVYFAVRPSSSENGAFAWSIPTAKSMFAAGVKHGEYKIIHIMHNDLTSLTFTSTESDIIYQSTGANGAVNKTNYKPKNNTKTFAISKVANSIPKFKITLHTYINTTATGPANLAGTRECYWDIDVENGSMSIFPDGTLNGQVLVATVNSPAIPTSKYLENANIATDAAIDLSKLAKVSTANRLLGATTANTSIVEVQVEKEMIKNNAVSTEKIEKIENKKVLGSLLNTGAQSGQNNPVGLIDVSDDLISFVSTDSNKHTHIATVSSIKDFVSNELINYTRIGESSSSLNGVPSTAYKYINFTHNDPLDTIYTIQNSDFTRASGQEAHVVVKSDFTAGIGGGGTISSGNTINYTPKNQFHNMHGLTNLVLLSPSRQGVILSPKQMFNNLELPLLADNAGKTIYLYLISNVDVTGLKSAITTAGKNLPVVSGNNVDGLYVPAFPKLVLNRNEILDPATFINNIRYVAYTYYVDAAGQSYAPNETGDGTISFPTSWVVNNNIRSTINTDPNNELIPGFNYLFTDNTAQYNKSTTGQWSYHHIKSFNGELYKNSSFDQDLNNVTCKGFANQPNLAKVITNGYAQRYMKWPGLDIIEENSTSQCVLLKLKADVDNKVWSAQLVDGSNYYQVIPIPSNVV